MLLLGRGLEGWMLDAATDATEICAFLEMTDDADPGSGLRLME